MDKQIINEFKNLKEDIKPRQEWVSSSRDLLLSQIKAEQKESVSVGFAEYVNIFVGMFRTQLLEPAVMMLLILATFLGSSLTINAAFYSLPGDNLYSVKIALENTHSALIQDDERKVELKMEFAQKRLSEFDKIVAQSDITPAERKKRIEVVVKEFKNNISAASDHLVKIKDNNGDANQVRMAVSVSSQSEELAKEIDEKAEELSEIEQIDVEEIVAEAVAAAAETGQSAQDLVTEAAVEEVDDAINEEITDETLVTDEADQNTTQESEDDTSDVEPEITDEVLE